MSNLLEDLQVAANEAASRDPELRRRRLKGQMRLTLGTAVRKALDLKHIPSTLNGIENSRLPEACGLSSEQILDASQANGALELIDALRVVEALHCQLVLSVVPAEELDHESTPLVYRTGVL